jgi:hypothetical protein
MVDWILTCRIRHGPNVFNSQPYSRVCVCLCVCVFVRVVLITWNVQVKLSETICCPSAGHEYTWRGSEGIAPFILNFNTRRNWVVRLTPGHFHLCENLIQYRRRPQRHSGPLEEGNYLFFLEGHKSRFLGHTARDVVTILTELSRLLYTIVYIYIYIYIYQKMTIYNVLF